MDRSRRQVKKNLELQLIMLREKERSKMREIRKILKKPSFERSAEETAILNSSPEIVHQIHDNMKKHKCLKERTKEIIDEPELLTEKCSQLADALRNSSCSVVYTGAGISTSAEIPDYRGPNGIWTLLKKGEDITFQDLSMAVPTYTHMALRQLHKENFISHIVSQNCDGLHLRSGLSKSSLSELHGNMFIEVCSKCKPLRQYHRLFDVTERTGLHRHKTSRFCNRCGSDLIDTIVHFGEKGTLPWPMNWKGAIKAAAKADVIVCLGSSLKVLKRYQGLWMNSKPHAKRPKLYIVNLQWTPKDSQATLKIHGRCDDVMEKVMLFLGIQVPKYEREFDPLFKLATPLMPDEHSSITRLLLSQDLKSECAIDVRSVNPAQLHGESEIHTPSGNKNDNVMICDSENLSLIGNESNNFIANKMQPFVKLLDLCNASAEELEKLNAKKIDSRTYFVQKPDEIKTAIVKPNSGWYGKGCAKLKKQKKKVNLYKRPKLELVI